jgi:hypothetical protein
MNIIKIICFINDFIGNKHYMLSLCADKIVLVIVNSCFNIRPQESKPNQDSDQNSKIAVYPFILAVNLKGAFFLDFIFRCISDKSDILHFHYSVTFINTSGTINAFHLCPVSNINSCGTYINTLFAINTIPYPLMLYLPVCWILPGLLLFTANKIIGNIIDLLSKRTPCNLP